MSSFLFKQDNKRAKNRRYRKTLEFLSKSILPSSKILDIGTANAFSDTLKQNGFIVFNTSGEGLDENPNGVNINEADVATAFEIFEHLLNPLGVLKAIKSKRLIASVPLSLWFAKAYRNKIR